LCDPEEEDKKIKEDLNRRSFVVRLLLGFSVAVLGFFVGAVQLLRHKMSLTSVKGGPYTFAKSDGRFTFVDVTDQWNDVGITSNVYKSLSNFDQEGKAFAKEACPPSSGPNLALVSCPNDGVKFVFPDETDRVMNVIKSQSQKVQVAPGRYSKAHILGASIRGSTTGLTGFLQYEGALTTEFELYFEPWRSASKQTDIVLDARTIYSADGGELSGTDVHAYLYHAQISCDPTRVLTRITLPSGCHCDDHEHCACSISDIRVLAITLEP
jgi:hypothetical protein